MKVIFLSCGGYEITADDGRHVGTYTNPESAAAHHAFAMGEIERLRAIVERLAFLIGPATAANVWLFERGRESERARVASNLNAALCRVVDMEQPIREKKGDDQ